MAIAPSAAGRPTRCSRSSSSRALPPNWHGVIRVVRSAEMLRGRAREHALVRRLRRLRVDVDQPLGRFELRDSAAAAPSGRRRRAGDRRAAGVSSDDLADLRRVEADPDLPRLLLGRTRTAGTPRDSRADSPAAASPCSARRSGDRRCASGCDRRWPASGARRAPAAGRRSTRRSTASESVAHSAGISRTALVTSCV